MNRKYWLDLFTGKTWEEFVRNGATVSGFRAHRKPHCERIHIGDYLICYLTGISRFVGVLEVLSECYTDDTPIYSDEVFPCRFEVRPVCVLTPDTAVPVLDLWDALTIFRNLKSDKNWSGFFRGSPNQFETSDGEAIVATINSAKAKPVIREYDQRKYYRGPKVYESHVGTVTVPDDEEKETNEAVEPEADKTTHAEIQWLLLKLGSDLGLDVWVARNDKNKSFGEERFQSIPRLRKSLPRQFDEVTNKTIEMIDVLWLQGDAILAAFEVEHSTSIYSGLLRMSDLVVMQPNIKINLYIVAPDDRHDKVLEEINRPTFKRLRPPLPHICKFLPYSVLKREIEQIGSRVRHLKPEFIDDIAENCESEA